MLLGVQGVLCVFQGQISGAQLNPIVTVMDALEGGRALESDSRVCDRSDLGRISGAIVRYLMFGLPLISLSRPVRSGPAQAFSEFVATFGLLSVIWGCSQLRSGAVAHRCRRLHHGSLLVHRVYVALQIPR
jgi:glycerol uptake facilitator-like aquaporin